MNSMLTSFLMPFTINRIETIITGIDIGKQPSEIATVSPKPYQSKLREINVESRMTKQMEEPIRIFVFNLNLLFISVSVSLKPLFVINFCNVIISK